MLRQTPRSTRTNQPFPDTTLVRSWTGRNYRTWHAQLHTKNPDARLLEGSNILEIVYLGTNPDEARLISGLIRDTYLETSLNFRKNEARRNADRSEEHTSELQSLLRISYAV